MRLAEARRRAVRVALGSDVGAGEVASARPRPSCTSLPRRGAEPALDDDLDAARDAWSFGPRRLLDVEVDGGHAEARPRDRDEGDTAARVAPDAHMAPP